MEAERYPHSGELPPPYSYPAPQRGPPPPATVTVSPVTVIHTNPANNVTVVHTSQMNPVAVVHTRQPGTYVLASMGAKSQAATCRNCHKEIITSVRYNTSVKTHVVAGIMCLFILWPCAVGTYFVNTFKRIDHYCPYCETHLGSYRE